MSFLNSTSLTKAAACAILSLCGLFSVAQTNTENPYSRYGLGEMYPTTLAHNSGMGNTFIALKPDSTMPVFINTGNPAAFALIRVTSLEVGGRFRYSNYNLAGSSVEKWSTNFSYATLGFPIAKNGGACFGIMPYSSTGYETTSKIDDIVYRYSGSGGLTKAFAGYGIQPFIRSLRKFRSRNYHRRTDTLNPISSGAYKRRQLGNKVLSDLTAGFTANYIFGSILHSARIIYPANGQYNNTYAERLMTLGDFTGNFGLQTGITFDSVRTHGRRRVMVEKTKLTFGYFVTLDNRLDANISTLALNYSSNSAGQELLRDTVEYSVNQPSNIRLPLTQGVGIGFKKAERINWVLDFARTDWNMLSVPSNVGNLQTSYRMSSGINWVPEKYATGRGSFWSKANYRFGASYETGQLRFGNHSISTWFVSTGIGFPVGIGRLSSMVNASIQYGKTGTTSDNLLKENFVRIHFGFTFCDRWFQKFSYD